MCCGVAATVEEEGRAIACATALTGSKCGNKTTPRGFEPLRAEPNGFRVHLLSRSDTVSCDGSLSNWPHKAILEMLRFAGERELQTTRSTFPELCSLLGLANLQEGCNVQEKCGE